VEMMMDVVVNVVLAKSVTVSVLAAMIAVN
jgi:hypothetical protein